MVSDSLLTRKEAARVLGMAPQTLAIWAMDGRNRLPMLKFGRTVRYRMSDLEKWMAAHERFPLAENVKA